MKINKDERMNLTQENINKYKFLYKARFGKDLSDKEALTGALSLVRLVQTICKPEREKTVKNDVKIL